jgi:sugar lactone lactonase YvrE
MQIRTAARAAFAAGLMLFSGLAAAETAPLALPGDQAYPENIASTADGALYVSYFSQGGVLRITPDRRHSGFWLKPGAAGTRSVLGLIADEQANLLWLCSNDMTALGVPGPNAEPGSTLKGFDLKTAELKVSAALPGAQTLCNDIAIDRGGSVYVTNTLAPEILKLSADRKTLQVWKRDPLLTPPAGGGLDGIAFGADGHLYVNTIGGGELFRIDVDGGVAGAVTRLQTSRALKRPDGLRWLSGNRFLMVEGGGSLDLVTIEGDSARIETLKDGLLEPTGVTRVDDTAWISEGQLSYLLDPAMKGKRPALPFRVRAVTLPK